MPESKARAILEVQVTGVNQGNNAVKGFQDSVTRSMTASEKSVASAIGGMIAQYASLAVAVQKAAKVMSTGIEFNKFVENQTMSFSVMMKSMSAAKEQMKSLYDFAVNSPLTFKETAGSAKQLMAYGFAAKELVPTMRTLGNVAIATGNRLDDIAYVYGTLRSQGRAYSRDLMQFGMRGIPIYEELAKVMGVNADQIQKMASQGKIGFKEVEKAFKNMSAEGGRFGGTLEAYMSTLTGKLSMLGDIAEQSAGTLMSGVTEQMGEFVDNLTKTLSDKGFQVFIKGVSQNLGDIAAILGDIANVLITLLPILGTFVKLWLIFKAMNIASSILKSIPKMLFLVGDSAIGAAVKVASLNSALAATNAASLSTALSSAVTGVRLLAGALKALIVSNPWLLVIAAIAGTVITIVNISRDEREKRKDDAYAASEIGGAFKSGVSANEIAGSTSQLEFIKMYADMYERSSAKVAEMLLDQRLITREVANQAGYYTAEQIAARYQTGNRSDPTVFYTKENWQEKFLSELNGKYKEITSTVKTWDSITKKYIDKSVTSTELDLMAYRKNAEDTDPGAKGGKAASDYLAAVQAQFDTFKAKWGAAYDDDKASENIDTALASIQSAIDKGVDIEGLFSETRYDEILQGGEDKFKKMLAGLSKHAKEQGKSLGTWWLPEESAVAVTMSAIDDAALTARKALVSAENEADAREKIIKANISAGENTAYWEQELIKLGIERRQIMGDITKYQQQQVDLAKYNEALSGKSGYWNKVQASAGNAYASGNIIKGATTQASAGMMQGTEVGSIVAGGNVFAQAVIAFVDMLKSIKNVNAAMNPFKTAFEATKEVIEPIANNIMKPAVQSLEQLGTVLGKVLLPFMAIIKVMNVFMYTVTAPLVGVLQALGESFAMLYDNALVPFGNAVIGLANAIIKVINDTLGWAGVNIEYIDQLETTTAALAGLTNTIENQKMALDDTISYLTKKINDAVDKQLTSLQDLYEVGAITATDYDTQVAALNAQKVSTDDVAVSASDMALTGAAMYERLYELYGIKEAIENDDSLTEAQISNVLTNAGLNATSQEKLMQNAVLNGMIGYGNATGTDLTNLANTLLTGWTTTLTTLIGAVPTTSTSTSTTPYGVNYGVNSDGSPKSSGIAEISGEDIANTVQGIANWVSDAVSTAWNGITSLFGFATGTPDVPADMVAQIHQGEGIIPATFMDGIRSGELSLSGSNSSSGDAPINIVVNVSGSVTSENDLVDTIAQKMYTRRKQGLLTV